MTETIMFGGVKLSKSEVAKTQVKNVEDPLTGKSRKVFIVDFKSGVKAAYSGAENFPGIPSYLSSNINEADRAKTEAFGILGLQITGNSLKQDDIEITKGTLIGVDIADGGHDDVIVHGAKQSKEYPYLLNSKGLDPSLGNIKADRSDYVSIRQHNEQKYSVNTQGSIWGISRYNVD